MSDSLNTFRSRHDRITISTVWVAFALSLALHSLLLWSWRFHEPLMPFEDSRLGKPGGSLAVRVLPPPSRPPSAAPTPPPAPAIRAQPVPAHTSSPIKAAQRPPSAPRALALERPSPSSATPPPAEAARAPASGDFASFVEARRRAREPAPAPASPPTETEQERDNRIAAANLGLDRTPTFGADRERGGGIFQVQRMGRDDAEFFFFGWNKAIRRNARQMIEVRRGNNPTMEIAVVRKMIAIIREYSSGDFTWESKRLGRDVSLSARMADNAGLEDFMMQEFFSEIRPRP